PNLESTVHPHQQQNNRTYGPNTSIVLFEKPEDQLGGINGPRRFIRPAPGLLSSGPRVSTVLGDIGFQGDIILTGPLSIGIFGMFLQSSWGSGTFVDL